ncbi:MAG TPA: Rrf2 family transcriptional regulator [Candidatus Acidoferrales bacterium]|nr:Rrf2 family transcriptional regulator [Candidatus Acidoferrales bacterium]
MFSRSAEYAVRAMVFLANQPPGRLTGAREVSEAEQIPGAFLWKILQNLTRRKLIRSFKGVHGGYELARPAVEITLEDIVEATDGQEVVTGCVLGLAECSEENPCPLHNSWKEVKTKLTEMLEQTTLADLAEVARKRKSPSNV